MEYILESYSWKYIEEVYIRTREFKQIINEYINDLNQFE